MGKHTIPAKARKSVLSAGSSKPATDSKGKLKHGGIGSGNAFENLTYRSKHEVLQLGKPKGKLKRPAASQSAALAARQQALLAELGNKERANTFIDERLEEHNSTLDTEDKLLLRFQKERMKRLQSKSRFAMEEDNELLTHQGEALSLGGPRRSSEEQQEEEGVADEDDETIERRLGASRALGRRGEVLDEEGEDAEDSSSSHTKSKHEVMSEVMLKSKMFRAERAVLQEEQQDLMSNLDEEFDRVRRDMQWATKEDRIKAKQAGASAPTPKKKAAEEEQGEADIMDHTLDPTDEFVLEARQLGLDVRAKASDRLKSDEELVAQEKKRLERLEKLRVKRMRGEMEGGADGEEEDDSDDNTPAAKRRRERKEAKASSSKDATRRPTDDDLEENFKLTSKAVGGRSADQVDEHELLSEDEGEEMDEDESEEESDEEEEDEEEEEEEEDEEEEKTDKKESKEEKKADAKVGGFREVFIGKTDKTASVNNALLAITAKLAAKAQGLDVPSATATAAATADSTKKSSAASSSPSDSEDANLPFTFPAPSTYKEFRSLISQYPIRQHGTIIARIKTCHHISLSPDNRGKMERFFAILLQHFRKLCVEYQKSKESSKTAESVAELIEQLDVVSGHIASLTEIPSMNASVGRAFRAQLTKMREEVEAQPSTGSMSFPPDHLFFFKLLASLFPTSDFRHNVVTPALLLMGESLHRYVVGGAADLVRGMWLCSLLLYYVNASKRVVPEIMSFLQTALVRGISIDRKQEEAAPSSAAKPVATKTKKSKADKAANGAGDKPATPTSTEETWSATPTSTRLHVSLQPRNCNFVPAEIAQNMNMWAGLVAVTQGKNKNKKEEQAAANEQDLRVPLHWLFLDNSAAVFTAPSARTPCAAAIPTFSTLLQLVHQAAQLWQPSVPSYPELFTPLLDAFTHILDQQAAGQMQELPGVLQVYTSHLKSYLSNSIAHSVSLRQPLHASLAPLALKQHTPAFIEGFNPTKDYDPIKERAEIKKLSHKLKREQKGALREIRRDTQVVVQQQRQLQNAYAAEREAKRREVWAQMEEQQRDTNILQKASKKKEKKAGKK